ncbi:MAG: hypothetical protein ABS939_00575 [Psychrobacillus sp.]
MKKKSLTIFAFILMVNILFTNSTLAHENKDNIVIEYYNTIEDLDEIAKKAQPLDSITGIGKIFSTVNGKEVITNGLVEKVKKITNKETGEEEIFYRLTAYSDVLKEEDYSTGEYIIMGTKSDDRYDNSLSVRGWVRAEYTSTTSDKMSFSKVSKWEAKYSIADSSVTVSNPKVFVNGWGETLSGKMIQDCSGWVCAGVEKTVPINSQNVWHSLYTPWANEYLMETTGFGQQGGFVGTLKRPNGNSWTHEVKVNFGMQ